MNCQLTLITRSENGKVFYCDQGCRCIVFDFNNIHQAFTIDDFYYLNQHIQHFDTCKFFHTYPGQDKIYISTSMPCLFFTFYEQEFEELRCLLADAVVKLIAFKGAWENLN